MASIRYGAINHWIRLNATTNMASVQKLKSSVRLRITAKAKVDKPMIMANVPTRESLSFHKLMLFTLKVECGKVTYISY